jgi:hypothetical protein
VLGFSSIVSMTSFNSTSSDKYDSHMSQKEKPRHRWGSNVAGLTAEQSTDLRGCAPYTLRPQVEKQQ